MIASDFVESNSYSPFKNKNSYLYDYLLYNSLYKKGKTQDELKEMISEFISLNEYISDRKFKFYLDVNFNMYDNENYSLNRYQINDYSSFLEKYSNIDSIILKDKNELKLMMISSENKYDSITCAVTMSLKNREIIKIKAKCFYVFKSIKKYENIFNAFIDQIKSDDLSTNYFNEMPIIPQTKYQKQILSFLNIKTFGDINSDSFYELLYLFIEDPNIYFEQLLTLEPQRYNKMCYKVDSDYCNFKDSWKVVFNNRIKVSHYDKSKTLQEVGELFKTSRERARQIEAKLHTKIGHLKYHALFNIENYFNYLDIYSKGYLSLEEFVKIFPNDVIKKMYITYVSNYADKIKVNLDYDVIFDSSRINIDEILTSVESDLPDIIFIKKYDNLSCMEKIFVDNNYKIQENKYYLKKGMKRFDLYLELIDELFPNGYRIYSNEDYNLLIEKYKEIYKNIEIKSKRALANLVERNNNYCLCGRGLYINANKCQQIPDYLYEEIIDYIKSSEYSVYYSEILNRFFLDLAQINIDNQFLLKGLLDKRLNNEFKTNRDSITYGNQISKWEAVLTYMRSRPGLFSLKDLFFKFPNSSYTLFQGIIAYESEHGMLILYGKKFIYVKNTNLESIRGILKNRIEEIFEMLNTDFITSHKLFAKIVLSDNNILKKINFEVDGFNMYSIVKYLYPDEYLYSRPIISKVEKGNLNTINAIHSYLVKYDKFDRDMAVNFIRKMNLSFKWISEFHNLCKYMSNEFLQVDKKTMIKKDVMNIDSFIIDRIDNAINDLLNKYKELNITNYNAYFVFPQIEDLEWNQYLVIGFINSYFDDKYEAYTKDSCNYIRRIDNEL